jgi:hypothetical protein
MRPVLSTLIAFSLLLFGSSAASAEVGGLVAPMEPTDAKHAKKLDDIRALLELTDAGAMGERTAQALLGQFPSMLPDVPQTFWIELAADMNGQDMVELVVPIYDRHLSHKTVKGLIKFYKGAAGQAWLDVQTSIQTEAMAAGEAWGETLAQAIIDRLTEDGFMQEAAPVGDPEGSGAEAESDEESENPDDSDEGEAPAEESNDGP